MNRYGYAGGNPVTMVGPTGRDCLAYVLDRVSATAHKWATANQQKTTVPDAVGTIAERFGGKSPVGLAAKAWNTQSNVVHSGLRAVEGATGAISEFDKGIASDYAAVTAHDDYIRKSSWAYARVHVVTFWTDVSLTGYEVSRIGLDVFSWIPGYDRVASGLLGTEDLLKYGLPGLSPDGDRSLYPDAAWAPDSMGNLPGAGK